jgi:IS30 family transposase
MEKLFLEDCLAKGMSLEAIGREVGKHPSTVGHWVKTHGLTPQGAARYAPQRGALSRPAEDARSKRRNCS